MTKLISKQVIADSGIAFGTSGARGLVTQFTAEVCAAFAHAFVAVMKESYEVRRIALAIDNRPSSCDMAKACAAALVECNIETVFYGVVPTPALAYAAMQENIPSIMITGSHIPFDRNGIKFYRPDGEISKADELSILSAKVCFSHIEKLSEIEISQVAADFYLERYISLFDSPWLKGKRIGIYEHSSAGRELYAKLFTKLGAEVMSLERSDQFVPIDTEAVSDDDKAKAKIWSQQYQFDAIFSTDGDGDRPMIADETGEWLRGDILGLLCSQALQIEALAVPVSCNTAIEACGSFKHVVRTRIGSPYVIAELNRLSDFPRIAGFEANGGYLLGSDIEINGKSLKALPTRDALLPALMLLMAVGQGKISELVNALPNRITHSDRIKGFATERSKAIIAKGLEDTEALARSLGFDNTIVKVDSTDGMRITFDCGDIVHLRPSGNAPEIRCYAEASNYSRAKKYVDLILDRITEI
ncbi:phosphomannomutase [Ferrimonas sediminum]|uniref:Phosphomannomutase n=1 Tax=Ferrimonas sediminum TaxID=718193 RepID=A0A1G8Z368_9GAMM|nr:phosphomannomutase [Ferrimonas sediminum]SDK08690.1 phosphomannomutase [Ferrimonas sediminum]